MPSCPNCGRSLSTPTCPYCGTRAVGTPSTNVIMWVRRVGATLVDGLILSVVVFGLEILFSSHPYIFLTCDFVLTGAYLVLFLTQSHGQTPGNRAAQTRVSRGTSGDSPSTRTATVRFLAQWLPTYLAIFLQSHALWVLAGIYVLVDILWPFWDAKGQTLHDKVAGTTVTLAPGRLF